MLSRDSLSNKAGDVELVIAVAYGSRGWAHSFFGFRPDFYKVIKDSVMTDHRTRQPTPHLQTRPATMLTAIGLCALIVLMQLVPEVQSMVRLPASAVATTTR